MIIYKKKVESAEFIYSLDMNMDLISNRYDSQLKDEASFHLIDVNQ